MNITVVGGGNVGTQIAAHCAEKKHRVTVYTTKPEKFCKTLRVVNEKKELIHEGDIYLATADEKQAFEDAELVFVTLPAYCMEDCAEKIRRHMREGIMICLVPGTGGGECAFRHCLEAGAVIFGLQRVPSVARLVEYGSIVCATGYRDTLHVAALPSERAGEARDIISGIFDMPCEVIGDYLNLTLTPSNPILHTTRLRTLFEDYREGVVYERIPLFYEEWSDESSRLLFKCDEEVQSICRALDRFDLSGVRSLKLHYESETPEALTRKIRSILGFRGLPTPSVKVEGGYIPDLSSRYFTADFSYGLAIIKQIADLCSVAVPNIEETLEWYGRIARDGEQFSFERYGICDRSSFEKFYKR